ncbi:hypothetical protein SAMN05192539_106131 [Paraburkholderia diazotrophica]|uniref:Uncharacterized protein n=1 Tax=Paraburkholderia diazotrophica TaxID=667676 RepID=A0A1H7EG02_9BURK|nr:hypothetical protein SAMN05192539_106131 [Paraburkholderia diazotrophica]
MSIVQGKHFERAGIGGITLNSLQPPANAHNRSVSRLMKVPQKPTLTRTV